LLDQLHLLLDLVDLGIVLARDGVFCVAHLDVCSDKFVSIHVTGLAYETDNWRSSTIDESEAYVSADLTKFANDSFIVSLKGGAVADWNDGDYGLSVGAGARIQLSKSLSIGSDYSVRAWFAERGKDSLARLFVAYKF
jgi:hypothetical protein